mmetsp:Transcript_39602/g.126490  ORF Transcript_39602/g.126490 Transcript_39602/m.126490 type:complete len:331 (-) Transcript_39602:757-1749(-)
MRLGGLWPARARVHGVRREARQVAGAPRRRMHVPVRPRSLPCQEGGGLQAPGGLGSQVPVARYRDKGERARRLQRQGRRQGRPDRDHGGTTRCVERGGREPARGDGYPGPDRRQHENKALPRRRGGPRPQSLHRGVGVRYGLQDRGHPRERRDRAAPPARAVHVPGAHAGVPDAVPLLPPREGHRRDRRRRQGTDLRRKARREQPHPPALPLRQLRPAAQRRGAPRCGPPGRLPHRQPDDAQDQRPQEGHHDPLQEGRPDPQVPRRRQEVLCPPVPGGSAGAALPLRRGVRSAPGGPASRPPGRRAPEQHAREHVPHHCAGQHVCPQDLL